MKIGFVIVSLFIVFSVIAWVLLIINLVQKVL